MAIFYFKIFTISKTPNKCKSSNIIQSVAYASGVALKSLNDGLMHYPRRSIKEIQYTGIMIDNLMYDSRNCYLSKLRSTRQKIWNKVEEIETRVNSRLGRGIIAALPKELSREQNIELLADYCAKLHVNYKTVIDFTIHDEKNGNGNFHCHIFFPTRIYKKGHFKEKLRFLDDRTSGPKEISALRELWSVYVNHHLKENGFDNTISHKKSDLSYKRIHYSQYTYAAYQKGLIVIEREEQIKEIKLVSSEINECDKEKDLLISDIFGIWFANAQLKQLKEKLEKQLYDRKYNEFKNKGKGYYHDYEYTAYADIIVGITELKRDIEEFGQKDNQLGEMERYKLKELESESNKNRRKLSAGRKKSQALSYSCKDFNYFERRRRIKRWQTAENETQSIGSPVKNIDTESIKLQLKANGRKINFENNKKKWRKAYGRS
jgi:hypothetical protein